MKRLFVLVFVGLLSCIVPQVQATETGGIGSPECREVQLEAQEAVESGAPYKNHGQMVRTAAHVVSAYEDDGYITEECAGCIVSQFARRIADFKPRTMW